MLSFFNSSRHMDSTSFPTDFLFLLLSFSAPLVPPDGFSLLFSFPFPPSSSLLPQVSDTGRNQPADPPSFSSSLVPLSPVCFSFPPSSPFLIALKRPSPRCLCLVFPSLLPSVLHRSPFMLNLPLAVICSMSSVPSFPQISSLCPVPALLSLPSVLSPYSP